MSNRPKEQSPNEKIVERINNSGFPLQMALEHQVEKGNTGWRVGTREHHWWNSRTGKEGWVDLVLEKRDATMVVECKRILNSNRTFLVTGQSAENRSLCRVIQSQYIHYKASGEFLRRTGVADLQIMPRTYQSAYCVNVGENAGDGRELLERIAAGTLSATEAIARSREACVTGKAPIKNYFTAIVTTASLWVAAVDPSIISLVDGAVPEADIKPVEYIRFMKQLWSGDNHPVPANLGPTLQEHGKAKEHTIFVINAQYFLKFLSAFEPDGEDWSN